MSDPDDTPGDVSTPELFRRVLDAQRRSIRTATPGRVRAYRRDEQTADVELPVRPDGEEQPVLSSVPVVCLGGGDGYLTFPHGAGDTGLVVFCDTEIGAWRASGDVGAPADEGRLNSAGPVYLPGLRPTADAVAVVAGATILAGSDVRLGAASATKAVVHEDAITAILTWADAVSAAITALGGDVTGALATLTTDLGAAKSPTVKVEG